MAAACLLGRRSGIASNRRYRLLLDPSSKLTILGEALQSACRKDIVSRLPEKAFTCNGCREHVLKVESQRQQLERSFDSVCVAPLVRWHQ